MPELSELIAQKEAIEVQIEEMRKSELAQAIAQAKAIIERHGLTAQDLFVKSKVVRKAQSPVAAKYRDSDTGVTWSGRGRMPKWLEGKNAADYLIT